MGGGGYNTNIHGIRHKEKIPSLQTGKRQPPVEKIGLPKSRKKNPVYLRLYSVKKFYRLLPPTIMPPDSFTSPFIFTGLEYVKLTGTCCVEYILPNQVNKRMLLVFGRIRNEDLHIRYGDICSERMSVSKIIAIVDIVRTINISVPFSIIRDILLNNHHCNSVSI